MARAAIRLAVVLGGIFLAAPGHAQPAGPARRAEGVGPLNITNPTLQASIERIAERSASWREEVESLRATGRQVIVLTSDQVKVVDAPGDESQEGFDRGVVAEVAPVPREDGRVDVVIAVVNLRLIEDIHRRRGSLPSEFHSDVDRILVHEIYGHALPYLLAGSLSGRCSDPHPGARAVDACSIRRENAVRAELGLGRRTTYGLDGLALMRGSSR